MFFNSESHSIVRYVGQYGKLGVIFLTILTMIEGEA